MPWTTADMKAKGAKRPGVAAAIANQEYRRCIAAGGTDKTCAPKAIIKGLGVAKHVAGDNDHATAGH